VSVRVRVRVRVRGRVHLDAKIEEGGDRYVVVNRQAARERRLG
jgi:hypothetical protein